MSIFPANHPTIPNIKALFDKITSKYDLMNDVMSFGLHRYWKRTLIGLIPQVPNLHLLDLASGTGDIAFGYLKNAHALNPQITLFDLSPHMIQRSKDQAINKNIEGNLMWCEGKAEALPFKDQSFDVCTVSFGLRNFENRDQALQEIYRILKPRGLFLCLEFSQPHSNISSLYELYTSTFIPTAGKILANDEAAYTYLVESIRKFPGVEDLKNMIERKGFNSVSYIPLTKGIAAIHRGWK
jgi:demethylmenaquinone methyltransferase/2-methoxy-6-polyprenyl-1,4-benzoquinol methylase